MSVGAFSGNGGVRCPREKAAVKAVARGAPEINMARAFFFYRPVFYASRVFFVLETR